MTLTRWGQRAATSPPDGEATGLDEFLEELLALEGVLMAALLDRSGRVMAARGFASELLEGAAALADGESGQAREYWERALEPNPDNEAARALMSPETGVWER